jgi:hypothetical protein
MGVVDMRSLAEIESCYDVEMTNDGLLQYHGGQGSAIYSVGSCWMAGHNVANEAEVVKRAVDEMDSYITWARSHPGPEVNLDEALAYRALLATHWNEQFRKEGHTREDELGPIEAVLE